MSCTPLAFTSRRKTVPLSSLPIGAHAIVSSVLHASTPRVEQLLSLGITPGALVTMMQRFPGVVFLCDQTELAVERAVADGILVRPMEELR
jgi:DtxR family transcriptional regulator, Mn-dependent transcriptional regulator